MTKHLLAIWLTAPLLIAGILTANIFSVQPNTGDQQVMMPTPAAPESGIARITSALLVWKIGEFRRRAIRLQLREEGRELLEEWLQSAPPQ